MKLWRDNHMAASFLLYTMKTWVSYLLFSICSANLAANLDLIFVLERTTRTSLNEPCETLCSPRCHSPPFFCFFLTVVALKNPEEPDQQTLYWIIDGKKKDHRMLYAIMDGVCRDQVSISIFAGTLFLNLRFDFESAVYASSLGA